MSAQQPSTIDHSGCRFRTRYQQVEATCDQATLGERIDSCVAFTASTLRWLHWCSDFGVWRLPETSGNSCFDSLEWFDVVKRRTSKRSDLTDGRISEFHSFPQSWRLMRGRRQVPQSSRTCLNHFGHQLYHLSFSKVRCFSFSSAYRTIALSTDSHSLNDSLSTLLYPLAVPKLCQRQPKQNYIAGWGPPLC